MPTVPYYQKIMDDIRRRIKAGLLKPGEKLPTTDELAVQYQVSKGTARAAIERLIWAGELRGHQGLGVFVPDAPGGAGPVDEQPS